MKSSIYSELTDILLHCHKTIENKCSDEERKEMVSKNTTSWKQIFAIHIEYKLNENSLPL